MKKTLYDKPLPTFFGQWLFLCFVNQSRIFESKIIALWMFPNIDQLIAQVEQLEDRSLETFLNKVNAIGTQRELAEGNHREKYLLKKIYAGFAPDKTQRIQLLQNKLQNGQILEAEHKELHKLLLQSSRHDIARLKLLIELSKIRSTTVPELVFNLKLKEVPAE